MKQDYWNVPEEQLIERTGKTSTDWIALLDGIYAAEKKSNNIVAFLQQEYSLPRYWARTLTTLYFKNKNL